MFVPFDIVQAPEVVTFVRSEVSAKVHIITLSRLMGLHIACNIEEPDHEFFLNISRDAVWMYCEQTHEALWMGVFFLVCLIYAIALP